jgi:hypothetical protein
MTAVDPPGISWRARLANAAPPLGAGWRWIMARADRIAPPRETYSQHGEDDDIWREWKRLRPGKGHGFYIDVGANHPSRLSNTHLLYRSGHRRLVSFSDLVTLRMEAREIDNLRDNRADVPTTAGTLIGGTQ